MIAVALRGLAARKLRAVLTGLAVLLGVAMISGTYVLTDTMLHAFDTIFVEASKGTDAVVHGRSPVKTNFEAPPPIAASILERVRALPQVQVAEPFVSTSAKLIDRDGDAIGTPGAPTMAMGVVTGGEAERFNPLELTAGRWAKGSEEVVIDARTAADHHFAVGDKIGVATPYGISRFTVAGIARFAGVDSIGGATMAIFDLSTAQGLFDRRDQYDSISVAARAGVSPQELSAALQRVLPAGVEAQTAADNVAENSDAVRDALGFIRYFLLAFAAIALFVGAFTIFNTLSITVAQRSRELATVRTLGASRRQVLGSVVAEALAIGAVASVVGLFAGLGLGAGLNALFVAFGIDTPQVGLVLATRTVLVSIGAGVGVTLLASLVPALRATRVPPIAAVREGAVLPPSRLARLVPFAAPLVAALGVGLLVRGAIFGDGLGTASRLAYLGAGGVLLFVGVAMLSTRAVAPLAAALGRPAEWLAGGAGRLARENAARNPGRTAVTAAALMVGLALVTFVAVLGQGMRSAVGDAVRSQLHADYVLGTPGGFETLPRPAGLTLDAAPGIIQSSSVRFDQALAFGKTTDVTGLDPRTIGSFYRFAWADGSGPGALARLNAGGALVTRSFADAHDLSPGSSLLVVSPSSKTLWLRVAGVYAPPKADPLLGDVAIGSRTFDLSFPEPRDLYTFADAGYGAQRALVVKALEPFPDAKLRTIDGLVSVHESGIEQLLNMMYVLLALSVIVSVFGIVNTLVLSVVERTREIGMLRAIGMTRRQVRRMVRAESVITSGIGAVLGIVLGLLLAALTTSALADWGVGFSVPVPTLGVLVVVTVLVGVVAAAAPARRASRLDVLRSLHYE